MSIQPPGPSPSGRARTLFQHGFQRALTPPAEKYKDLDIPDPLSNVVFNVYPTGKENPPCLPVFRNDQYKRQGGGKKGPWALDHNGHKIVAAEGIATRYNNLPLPNLTDQEMKYLMVDLQNLIENNFIQLCREKGQDYFNASWFNGKTPSEKRKASHRPPAEKKGKSKRLKAIEKGDDTALNPDRCIRTLKDPGLRKIKDKSSTNYGQLKCILCDLPFRKDQSLTHVRRHCRTKK